MDVLCEGGASGSPIFLTHDPRAIGILHAGFNGAPITYGVPGHLIKAGLDEALASWQPNLDKIPTLQDVVAASRPRDAQPLQWSTIRRA
jgi:hypothetical protein